MTWEVESVDDAWETIWRQALLPQQITPTYTLRPTHCAPGPPSENTLWFEPEESFGSGEHATTRMAAVAVEEHLRTHPGLQFLDVGTGTGVLAFIAAKTGARRAVGVDTDEVAIRSAQRNADLNDLTSEVEILSGGAEAVTDTFEIVVANINTDVLLSCKEAICARVCPGGTLFLTGLLDEDVQEVCIAYATEGIDLDPIASDDGWTLLKGLREE
jgi:ribosomal protein L11 methyltransferase